MNKQIKKAVVAGRARDVKSFIVVDLIERAFEMRKQGRRPILLSVGEPDFPTPRAIVEAACKAMVDGRTKYTHSQGIIELREAIAAHYSDNYGVHIDPGRIMVCSGTSPAMLLLFGALLERGDQVIMSDPGYACYPNFVRYMSGEVVAVPVNEVEGFILRPEDIAERMTDRTKGILINSPCNPTGNVIPPDRMRQFADLGVPIISDEIYHGLVYEGKAHSMLEFAPNAFVLNGFSKRYAMTGWRLGYMVVPGHFMGPLRKVQQNVQISVNTFVQHGAVAALTDASVEEDVAKMAALFDQRRKYMLDRLKKMGFDVKIEPTGAFYVFVNARHLTDDSLAFSFDCLERAEVAVTPGIDFGQGGEGFLRLSYANSMENIEEGLGRLEKYISML